MADFLIHVAEPKSIGSIGIYSLFIYLYKNCHLPIIFEHIREVYKYIFILYMAGYDRIEYG